MKKSDMSVYAELLEDGQMLLILGGMDLKTKIKLIKQVIFGNELKVYLTNETVKDLKCLLERA